MTTTSTITRHPITTPAALNGQDLTTTRSSAPAACVESAAV